MLYDDVDGTPLLNQHQSDLQTDSKIHLFRQIRNIGSLAMQEIPADDPALAF